MKSYLRMASELRQVEWGADALSLHFRGIELLGEVGEAANVMKKLERERLGIRGSRATVDDLANELADVVICADLVGLDVGEHVSTGRGALMIYSGTEFDALGVVLGKMAGRALEMIEMVVRARLVGRGERETVDVLASTLGELIKVAHRIASERGIDLDAAVVAKFNATSEKIGLKTRMKV
jgi:hypothetical protein